MTKRHLIISGTGRAGTTFLVQLLTELGLDTGYADSRSNIFENCNAGMERDPRDKDAPYIVKSPFLCDYLDDVLRDGQVGIDHAIIPIRDLHSAAESRRDVARRSNSTNSPDQIPGGLWKTQSPGKQEVVLLHQLYKLVHTIAQHDIPMTFLYFPRLVKDPEYLFGKLGPLLPGVEYARFLEGFRATSRPELVHDFRAAESKARRSPWARIGALWPF